MELRDPAPATRQLVDAYIAVGAAIAELRSLPLRRYSDFEEDLHISAATRFVLEGQKDLDRALTALGRPPMAISVEPKRLGVLRLLQRLTPLAQIGRLHGVRRQISVVLAELGHPRPDDLPDGNPLERWAMSPNFERQALVVVVLWLTVVLGFAVYVVATAQ